jgi:hypothetical protein
MRYPEPPGHAPDRDDEDSDIRTPPVPPDKQPDVVPQRDPPKPGRRNDEPPMIALNPVKPVPAAALPAAAR